MNDKKKILVVDDNPQSVEMITVLLEDIGFEVAKAFSGEAALCVIRLENPDIVLLDLNLPGIDGLGVCEKIKNDPELKDIPVIMVTGERSGEAFEGAMKKRADRFINKPVDFDYLMRAVEELLAE